jgi:hypothetical protein
MKAGKALGGSSGMTWIGLGGGDGGHFNSGGVFDLFYHLPRTVKKIFSGWNLLGHALAIGLTILIVGTGLDWRYYQATRVKELFALARPALRLGVVLPICAPLWILAVALAQKRVRLAWTAWGMGQAALLGYLVASTYKAFTGRLPPPLPWRLAEYPAGALSLDSSHGFQLGFWRGGIFGAGPHRIRR